MAEKKVITSPLKAIRERCLDCCEDAKEVKLCPDADCPLYPFRFGKNPFLVKAKREYTEEEREKMRERMKALNLEKKQR